MIRTGIASSHAIGGLIREGIIPTGTLVSSDRDTVFVAHHESYPLSVLVARPMWWVHGLDLNPTAPRRLALRSLQPLVDFATGYSLDRPLPMRGAILQVSPTNDSMKEIAASLRLIGGDLGLTYRLNL